MKIIKPLRLSILNRPFSWQTQNFLGISVLALCNMGDKHQLRPEPELWQLVADELSLSGGVVDLGIPKAHAEFLATGNAYTHHQNEKTACAVRIDIGNLTKTINVFGERHWVNNTPSKPLPFDCMRLDWSKTYGGVNFADNPYGIGSQMEDIAGIKVHRLPNIEAFNQLSNFSNKKFEPTCFSGTDITWPSRFKLVGKNYNKDWFEKEFPGFANDIDWRLFNMAQQDQQWANQDRLPEQAHYKIWNMHPSIPCQQGKLPNWQAHCFINRVRNNGEEIFEHVSMRPTTVWFFPDKEVMLLIYQGSLRINEDDAADVKELMAALEIPDEPRGFEHYQLVREQRMNKEKGAFYAFREKDLIPKDAIGHWIDTEPPQQQSAMIRNMEQRELLLRKQHREHLLKLGKNPDDYAVEPEEKIATPALDELPEFIELIEKKAEKAKEDAFAKLREKGFDPEKMTPIEQQTSGHESYKNMAALIENNKKDQSEKQKIQTENALHQMYLMAAHAQAASPKLTPQESSALREHVLTVMAGNRDFSGMDLTGADLSDLDLSRACFRKTLMEGVTLHRSCLDGSDFSEAILTRADIVESSLQDTILDKASLALARCYSCKFTGASINETNFQEAILENNDFSSCSIINLFFYKTIISGCSFDQSKIETTNFLELPLRDLSFQHAMISKVTFIKCQLEMFDFSHATLESCSMVETTADSGLLFTHATLINCAFASETTLKNSDFSYALLKQCNLRQIPLHNANFSFARFNNSDLSEAKLIKADLSYINGSHSMFIRTDFTQANLTCANLINAVMQKAILYGANLTKANLFRADLSQSVTDLDTLFHHSNTQRTKTLPQRSKDII